ncbi:MAG: ABC transporter ATP-binding protein [Verrucomicrobia bacterium]|nr:ABC transporter ATP-binding protein [Verrucomicrobiota bacterium]
MIEVTRVTKTYDSPAGPVPVLRDLDLRVAAGESVAIVGPSGSGKTTLLNLLGALDQPTSGTLAIDDTPLGSLDPEAAARFRNRTIGFVFQLHYLLPQCSVLENVLVPRLAGGWTEDPAATRARAEALLEQVGLQDRLEHRPWQLSGGEQLRVAIARALINQPKLVLADEPTGSLDPATGERIAELFLQTNAVARAALVVVTHNPTLASRMSKTYRFESGRLVG